MPKKGEKLEQIIAIFNQKEVVQVKKFLNSPFFNLRSDVRQLFDLLLKSPDLSREEIYQMIYPKEHYDDQKMRLLRSYLFQLIEKYLAVKTFLDHELEGKFFLTQAYRQRGLESYFTRSHEKAKKALHKQPRRHAGFYEYSYRLQWEQYLLASADSPSEPKHLLALSNTIDIAYLTLKLKNACLLAAQQSIYKSELSIQLLDEVLQHVQQEELLDIPAIAIYYYGFFMFREKEEERFFKKFKALVIEHGTKFPKNEIRDLYLMAINYCVRELNEGNEAYFQEAFELYQEGLDQQYLLDNGVLSRFTYHNIVAVGLKLGEFEWVEFFIQAYKNTLERKYRDSSFSFNTARLEFSRRNYDIVLELLQRANYRDLLLNLAAKTLLLKTYYELQELDLLQAHLEAMKNFIRRKGIIGYHKTNYLNIIRLTQKLINLNFYDRKEVEDLKTLIQGETILTEKQWLIERMNG